MRKAVRKMQKANAAAQAAVYTKVPPELLDQLVKGPMTADAVDDLSRSLKKVLIDTLEPERQVTEALPTSFHGFANDRNGRVG